jgi:uncharacterized integral membrane protein
MRRVKRFIGIWGITIVFIMLCDILIEFIIYDFDLMRGDISNDLLFEIPFIIVMSLLVTGFLIILFEQIFKLLYNKEGK